MAKTQQAKDPVRESVRAYLEELGAAGPRRGRPRLPEKVRSEIAAIEGEMVDASVLKRLSLAQRRLDLLSELERLEGGRGHLAELEEGFVKFAGEYSARKGISFGA